MTLSVGALVGCDKAGEPMTVSQDVATPASTPSEIPSETPVGPTPTLNAKELYFAHLDETEVAVRTEVALTGVPTRTPGAPPPYTGPTTTPVLGLLRGCANKNSLEPNMVSCWAGIYNGNIINVRTGSEGLAGDLTQGLVWVYNRDTHDSQFIQTPDKAGAVQITSVDSTLFTLTTVDHTPTITYTFDLASRQWVSPAPTPSPSTSPLPTLTASP
jgi:hypothetical protein